MPITALMSFNTLIIIAQLTSGSFATAQLQVGYKMRLIINGHDDWWTITSIDVESGLVHVEKPHEYKAGTSYVNAFTLSEIEAFASATLALPYSELA